MTQSAQVLKKLKKSGAKSRKILQPGGAKFLMSVPQYNQLPRPSGIEYCIMGRSNVGKSSFMNHILDNKTLARVSKTPGKTNCANMYQVNNSMVWVDLPGYGYAKVSHHEKKRWSKLISDYCRKRENIGGIIWLIDIRHVGVRADVEAFEWLSDLNLPVIPVLTKSDKLSQRERAKQLKKAGSLFPCEVSPVVYSIRTPGSREQFWKQFRVWIKIHE